jgi:ceramide glucosyltransferase
LRRTLTSSASACGEGPVSVRFAVAHPRDGAADVARAAAAELVRAGIDAGVDFTSPDAPNQKAGQLARVLDDEPRAEIVVVADSDVELDASTFASLMASLREAPSVAAVWAVPVEVDPATLGDRASAAVLDASLHSFALLSPLDGDGMVGKLFAIRTDALEAVGGFRALSATLGEDMELKRRLQSRGFTVAVASVPARSLARGRSWAQVRARYARWVHVIRAQRPALLFSYPGLLAATPLIVVAAVLSSLLGGSAGMIAAALACVARLGAGLAARVRTGQPPRLRSLAMDIVLADFLLLSAFVQAVATRRVDWRGRVLQHVPGGRIEEVRP